MLKWIFGVVLFAAIPAAAQIGHEHRHREAGPAATTADADYSRFANEMNAGDPLFRNALNSVWLPSHSFV